MKKELFLAVILLIVISGSGYSSENMVCYTPKKTIPVKSQTKKKDIANDIKINDDTDENNNLNTQVTQLIVQPFPGSCEKNNEANKKDVESTSDFFKFILDLIVKLISNLAWPIVVFVVLLKFRDEISQLIKRVRKFSVGGSEVEMSDLPDVVDNNQIENISPDQQVKANLDPRGSIISAWLNLDAQLYKLYQHYNLDKGISMSSSVRRSRVTPGRMLNDLINVGALSPNEYPLIKDLLAIRNRVAHEIDFDVSEEDVVKYISLANDLEVALKARAESGYRY